MTYDVQKMQVAALVNSNKLKLTIRGLIGPGIEQPLGFLLTTEQARDLAHTLLDFARLADQPQREC